MRRRGKPWSKKRWRKFNEKRKRQMILEARLGEEAAALAEYESEKRRAALSDEFAAIAEATNQLVTPFDDSPMGELHLELCTPRRLRTVRKQALKEREIDDAAPVGLETAHHVLAWWHR